MNRLVSITPFATHPPKMGGQVVIDAMNREFPALGWQIDQFSMGIRKPDLFSIGRTKRFEILPGYTEWRRTEPVTVGAFSFFSLRHLGFLNAGKLLKGHKWIDLQDSVLNSQAILFESPWCYEPGALIYPKAAPLVYLAHNAEFQLSELYKEQERPFTNSLADLIERSENQVLRDADIVIPITPQDANSLYAKYNFPKSKMHVIPRGINLDRFSILSRQEKCDLRNELGIGEQIIALFVGSAHGPNLAAAESLIKTSEQVSENVLIIVAGRAAKQFNGQNRKNLWFIPEAPQPYLQIADIALNPVMTGSGLNIKMLEYFGLELPCVSTIFGVRGIDGKSGEDYIVVELDELAGSINILAQNPDLRNWIGKNGRKLAEEKYSARVTAQKVLKLIEDWKPENSNKFLGVAK